MRRCQRSRHSKKIDSSATVPHGPPLLRVEQTEVRSTETERAQQLRSGEGSHASILPGGTTNHRRISQPAHHVWGRGGGTNNPGVAFTQTAQPGGTKNYNPPGGTKPPDDQKGIGKKTNLKGVLGCFFCKQKGIDDTTHWVSDCPLAKAPEKAGMVEKMRRGINRQVQANEAAAQEEHGTENVNVAAGPTTDEVRTLIADPIEEMEGVRLLQSASDHPMVQQQK